jgi:hypothetical protein
MPIYLDLSNLIIPKIVIQNKYLGGIEGFKQKYYTPVNRNQEDNELFCLVKMNADEFNLQDLVRNGLSFDSEIMESPYFCIINRYGNPFWKVKWISYNSSFAWHQKANKDDVNKAKHIGEQMTMDQISQELVAGNNLLQTIK